MAMKAFLASLCAALYFIQAFLHGLILLGLPFGRFFFGGIYSIFPLWLRPVNLFFVLFWSFLGFICLAYGRIIRSRWQEKTLDVIMISMTGLSFLASIFNLFISSSPLEKYGTGSMTVLTFIGGLCLIISSKSSH